jgi:Zn-dependent protease/predicted transcriptional regulator
MQPSLIIGRIAGVHIGLHYSWILIAVLLAGSFVGYFYESNPNWQPRVIWSAAIVITLLFFGSIVLHELAHALVAGAFGMPVRTITLFALGGVANIERDAATPKAEFWMGVAGPVMSGAIGWVAAALASWWGQRTLPALMSPPVAVLVSLSSLNFMLAIFNLIPGFPLDGGRLLRAIVWWVTGNSDRATRISARMGQGVALALFAFGVWQFLAVDGIGGIWLALLGWFLLDAATASHAQVEVVSGLRGLRVGDVMSSECARVPADTSAQRFADEYVLRTGERCYVVEEEGTATGLITPSDLKQVDRARWPDTPVRLLKRPLHQLRAVSPDTPVVEALETMGKEDVNQLPVMSDGQIEGVLSRRHILQVLQARLELSM